MSWPKPSPLLLSLALVTIAASACGPAAGKVASGKTPGAIPSALPSATPSATAALSPVPGVLVPPATPVPMPTDASLSAASSDVVWVLLQGSFLYRSTNRGTTWEQRPMPPGDFPRPEISFVDDREGWFATGGVPETQCNGAGTGIWHTSDGGANWQQVVSVGWEHQTAGHIGYRQCKEGLSFVDAMHGFLGASDPNSRPTIYRTADGGSTWQASTLPDPPGFVTLGAGDALRPGLVKGLGGTLLLQAWGMQPNAQLETEYIFRSLDGGASWSYATVGGQGIDNVTFVTEARWLKLFNDGAGQETTDAGKSWHAYPSDYRDAAGVNSYFVFGDSLVGYGTVRGGIRRTVDGGRHWASIKTPGAYQP